MLSCSVSCGIQLATHDTLFGCLFIPYLMRLPGNITSIRRTIAKDEQREENTKWCIPGTIRMDKVCSCTMQSNLLFVTDTALQQEHVTLPRVFLCTILWNTDLTERVSLWCVPLLETRRIDSMTTVTSQLHTAGREVAICIQLCTFNKVREIAIAPKNKGLIIYIHQVIRTKLHMLHLSSLFQAARPLSARREKPSHVQAKWQGWSNQTGRNENIYTSRV